MCTRQFEARRSAPPPPHRGAKSGRVRRVPPCVHGLHRRDALKTAPRPSPAGTRPPPRARRRRSSLAAPRIRLRGGISTGSGPVVTWFGGLDPLPISLPGGPLIMRLPRSQDPPVPARPHPRCSRPPPCARGPSAAHYARPGSDLEIGMRAHSGRNHRTTTGTVAANAQIATHRRLCNTLLSTTKQWARHRVH